VDSLGIALCEIVDPTGRPTSASTVDWRELDVSGPFDGRRVALESDVRAAALAEARLGAGMGLDSVLYVSIGTGVSHCLVLDGTPVHGAHGAAIITGAPPVEETGSGLALQRRSGRSRVESVLQDPALDSLVEDAAAAIGLAVAALVNALDPAVVVVGGGLGLEAGFRGRITETARRAMYPVDGRDVRIVPAALATRAPIVGAALAAAGA
jgi:glucokinase